MSLQLLPDELAAIEKTIQAANRIHSYCKVMLDRGAPLDDIDRLSDVHAASCVIECELLELVATINGTLRQSYLIESKHRLLYDAMNAADSLKANKELAPFAQKAALALDKLTARIRVSLHS